MKLRLITTSLILSLAAFNAHAFKSISLQYPEGVPAYVQLEESYSTGNCNLPSKNYNCQHRGSTVMLSGKAAADSIQNFSNEFRNVEFKKDPMVKDNNFIKLTLPDQKNVCRVNLKMNRHIVINLLKNGSCNV